MAKKALTLILLVSCSSCNIQTQKIEESSSISQNDSSKYWITQYKKNDTNTAIHIWLLKNENKNDIISFLDHNNDGIVDQAISYDLSSYPLHIKDIYNSIKFKSKLKITETLQDEYSAIRLKYQK